MQPTREEADSLGARSVPADRLYGVQTLRAVENFSISGRTIGSEPALLRALARIKRAAAAANRDVGTLDPAVAEALIAAADEVIAGSHAGEFPVDMLEGSGGTSINMNMNEVLANRALEIRGHPKGSYGLIHPNDHVNRGQSTNDVVPSAVKLAAFEASGGLAAALGRLADALAAKAAEFDDVLRVGRTCLQPAQPMRLGQAFGGYAAAVRRQGARLDALRGDLLVLPLGGTAIGTGLGAAPGFRARLYHHLADSTGQPVRPAGDLFDAMQNADGFARASSEVRIAAEVMAKIAGDLIVLCAGGGAGGGAGEIGLPAVQPGSSIMPGKVNPVLPMMVQQAAFAVMGNDAAVALAALGGQLEINHFEPIIASRLLDSIRVLTGAALLFADRCVAGVRADRARSLRNLLESPALATAFVPRLGYARVAELVGQAQRDGRPFVELAVERGLLTEPEVIDLLRRSTEPQ